jgi:hypothetical protein
MRLTRRECLAIVTTFAMASGCKLSPPTQTAPLINPPADKKPGSGGMAVLKIFKPEDFGAVGDGVTNDTDAFAKMTFAVNGSGGGRVVLRPTTYIVGGHTSDPSGVYAYAPASIMDFDGCTGGLSIEGNGARLRCADGLRFGTFDPATGAATIHEMPYYGTGELASPYAGMITVQNCRGKIYIEDLELDGNLEGLLIGGPRGDTGWQIGASGLRLINNIAGEWVTRVHSHHHALDGLYIDGAAERPDISLIEDVVSEYNVRQGCSVVGGRNYSFFNCKFNHTGKARMTSAPSAGIDIEAESSPIRNLKFSGCEFSNNTGVGMLAEAGDSEGAVFNECRFIGTTAWSAWPRKPRYEFQSCQFVGSICNTFGDSDATRAAQFHDCSFLDDPTLSPTGEVYKSSYPIADLNEYMNVLFDGCKFTLGHESVLPWSVNALYKDSIMSQTSNNQAYPRGTYLGTNRINGNVDLYGSKILGDLTVNGQVVPRTS